MLDFSGVPRSAVSAPVYRVVHKGIDPLSSRGSELNGGRYNSPGTKGVLEKLQISAAALIGDNLALTRQIAQEALTAGFDTLVAPSAAQAQGKNVVILLGMAAQVPTVKASTPVALSKKGGS